MLERIRTIGRMHRWFNRIAKLKQNRGDREPEGDPQERTTDDRSDTGDPDGQDRRLNLRFLILALLFLMVWSLFLGQQGRPERQALAYSEFKSLVQEGRVQEVTFEGERLFGELKATDTATTDSVSAESSNHFLTQLPQIDDPQLLSLLEGQGVVIRANPTEGPWWARILFSLLPWVLVLGLFFYFSYRFQKRMSGGEGQGGVFGFGKSKAKRFRETNIQTCMDDVAGVENAKLDLQEIIDHLGHPDVYHRLGASLPKGVLLVGPPGTGKTLMARAIAGEASVPFYSISGSEFVEMFVGVGAARVRDMFESAKKEAPCVIFIDEIDAVGRARGAGLGGGHDEREQTLNQILSEMDGFSPQTNVVVLAATNRPDVLDNALLRPGRFDRKVTLDLPDRKARRAILDVHVRKVPLADDVDLERIAARTVGFSGADLKNLVNEAALMSGRERLDQVDMSHFEQARDKLILGAERERGLIDEDRRVVAYHESGHAMMAWLLPLADPLEKVTIIPRGRALGATEQLPQEERLNLRRDYLLDRIGVMLGGRVAEQVVFGQVTSGAESDLEQATRLARHMVCRWGMSEAIGPVSIKSGQEHVFLGREIGQERDFSEATAELIDREIRNLLDERENHTRELMQQNRAQLDLLAERLLDMETLVRSEIDQVLQVS